LQEKVASVLNSLKLYAHVTNKQTNILTDKAVTLLLTKHL